MRQRASTKTQRRLQQQLRRDPYALTDDVYSEAPTLRVGGLVTAAGALQLAAVVALGGLVFGGALLFCLLLLAAVGIALLRRQDAAGPASLGLYQTFGRLLALRRGALDYSVTLSIAQSGHYQEKRDLQIAVVPTSPTPQKVVAAMSLSQPKAPVVQNRKTPLAGDAPLATLNHVQMKPLHTINSFSVEEEVHVEKPRSRSEPKQVLRSRPLLAPKPKVQEKKTTEKTAPVAKAVAKAKAAEVLPKKQQKKQQAQAQPVAKTTPKQQPKKESRTPSALPKTEAKPVMPPVLAKAEPKLVQLKPTFAPVQTVAAPPAAVQAKPIASEMAPAPVPVVPTLPVLFPERKSIVELARGEPAMERDLVVTRKVLLYLDPEIETVEMEHEEHELELELEAEQQLERELEHAWAEEQEHAKEEIDFTMESFPPLSPPLAPLAPPTPLDHHAEPNFLLDITLEPFSEPEKKIISFKALSPRKVRNADIRAMLDELDVMSLELDAAMAKCTRLLKGEEEKVSAPPSSELEPEEEPIFCC